MRVCHMSYCKVFYLWRERRNCNISYCKVFYLWRERRDCNISYSKVFYLWRERRVCHMSYCKVFYLWRKGDIFVIFLAVRWFFSIDHFISTVECCVEAQEQLSYFLSYNDLFVEIYRSDRSISYMYNVLFVIRQMVYFLPVQCFNCNQTDGIVMYPIIE
jgi:hypothetical protein